MKIVIGADQKGTGLKRHLITYLERSGHEVIDCTPLDDADFVTSASAVAQAILNGDAERGIAVDEYGAGSFMVASKHKGIICAEVSDEHSARMTRDHNNASMIALGSGIVGETLAEKIVEQFVDNDYSGGRHQIRVDMLNKMC